MAKDWITRWLLLSLHLSFSAKYKMMKELLGEDEAIDEQLLICWRLWEEEATGG